MSDFVEGGSHIVQAYRIEIADIRDVQWLEGEVPG